MWRVFFKCMNDKLVTFPWSYSILCLAQPAFLPGKCIDDAIDALLATWDDFCRRRSNKRKTPRAKEGQGMFIICHDKQKHTTPFVGFPLSIACGGSDYLSNLSTLS